MGGAWCGDVRPRLGGDELFMSRLLRVCWVVGAAAGVAMGQSQPPAPQKAESPAAEKPASQPAPPLAAAEPKVTPLAHVEVHGTGPVAVVLIPGLVSEWTAFEPFMARNAARYTMYAVTLPGFGGSEPPPTPADGESYAAAPWLANAERAVMSMVAERKLDKPVLLGQSMGGFVALRTAAHHPGAFRSVVVLNSMPAWPIRPPTETMTPEQRAHAVDAEISQRAKQASDAEWMNEQARWIAASVPDPVRAKAMIASAAGVPKAVSSRYMLEYLASDLSGEIGKIGVPTLVIAPLPLSDPHPESLRIMWRQQFAPVVNGTVVFFEDSGELITEDSPAALDRAIEQFLSGGHVDGKKAGEAGAPAEPAEPAPRPSPAPEPTKPGAPTPTSGEPQLPPSLVHPAPGSDAPAAPKPTEPK